MKKYDVYLLDFDGTMADSARSLVEVYRAGFDEVGVPYDPNMAKVYMHMSLDQTAKMVGITDYDDLVKFAVKIGEALDYPENLVTIDFFPETRSVCKTLHESGKKLSVVSGNTETHIRLVLKAQNLEELFDGVVGTVPERRPKPYPDPILAALENYPGVSKDKAVYVGDSLQDVEAARAAGIDGILIDRNDEHPDFEGVKIQSLNDLLL